MLRQLSAVLSLSALILVTNAPSARAETAGVIAIELRAGQHDRQDVPVFFELPVSLLDCESLKLERLDTNRPVAVQIEREPRRQAVWMIDDRLAAGTTRRYRLTPGTARSKAALVVSVADDGKRLLVEVGGRPVLQYNHAVVRCPDQEQPYFDRSGFIHPVFSPSGQVVTDGMPPDHYHQHGIMFPWTNTTFEGRPVDFWNSKSQQGKVEHVKFTATAAGPVFASFTAVLAHVDLTAPGGPKTVLEETWRVRVYNRTDGFLFDLHSSQTCAGESPLQINEYHYGAMAIRGARAWFEPGCGDFLTSEGKTRADGNHSRPRWCDIYGQEDGHTSGVTTLCHPDNFRFPQPVRLHPTKPYFCWSPMVLGPLAVEPGTPYVSQYRYYVHDDELDPQVAKHLWHDLADPPQVRVVRN